MENSEDFDNWLQQNRHESRKDKFGNASYFYTVIIKLNIASNEMANVPADPIVEKLNFDTDSCALSQDIHVNDFASSVFCRRLMLNLVMSGRWTKQHTRTK